MLQFFLFQAILEVNVYFYPEFLLEQIHLKDNRRVSWFL